MADEIATRKLPIGVFDSGVGGLTVLREVRRLLPAESTLYLGDTARVPYGTKSPQTVQRYGREVTGELLRRGIKLLVIGCNTASAVALGSLREKFEIPLTGVIVPGARAAAKTTKNGRIGVIGTSATVRSGAYEEAIKAAEREIEVFSAACPLFVALAEEGWTEGEIAELAARSYLGPFMEAKIDTLVLGCTHYPLLAKTIAKVMGEGVQVIDSATAAAEEVVHLLKERDLATDEQVVDSHRYLVTDSRDRFLELAPRFLERGLDGSVEEVQLQTEN